MHASTFSNNSVYSRKLYCCHQLANAEHWSPSDSIMVMPITKMIARFLALHECPDCC